MRKLLFVFAMGTMASSLWAVSIREYQTTRLNSTAGAGVASILSTEAAVLNPATSAFFADSGATYQRVRTALRNKSDVRQNAGDRFAKRNETHAAFISDSSGELKGGVAYIQQAENDFRRERAIFHSASPMGAGSSFGVSYNYIQDKRPSSYEDRNQVHHQISAGVIHVVDENTTLGGVIQDPTRTTPGEERAIVGFQYNITSKLTLMGDVGARYTKAVTEEYLWRAGLQINVFSDFFLRGGQFYDNVTEFKGMGWGVAWIGPRLGVEFSQKISDQIGKGRYIYKDEQLVDTALSAIIKF